MTDPVLAVDAVSVRFGAVRALSGVGLAVAPGERVALLGHNGAGKSTLFKSVLGFVTPDAGTIAVAGGAPGSLVARRAVSYLPEAVAFPKSLTGRELLAHFARLKGEDPRAAMPLLERVGIAAAADRRVGTYSKGMRQRLGLAQALIGRPGLLLLDEPTSGLDPVSRRDFYSVIADVAAAGTAVLLSSHSLSEVESKTDRIVILSAGRVVAEGTLAELTRRAGLPIVVRVEAEAADVDRLHRHLGGTRENGTRVVLACSGDDKLPLLARIAAVPDLVADVEIVLPGLDDVYDHFSRRPGGPS
ncbi:ABC transporter ATP-binding protein [Oharaeibacter diazotrophicus]|uniref:Cu-processing system ATP-binding protein n=1 Tax=Oharaeibacter diazotrophicus TaxID=1920512 RepID=A0A4R6RGI8_9HYPH|nr:ABC transporter ATP-binding protein [Oharaeibacter diazotrophicus]TDP85463.1 Cu-processing system ATP-binding protein [Oharaeibacter diazotrophicus]BBE74433.1 putative ABC transporter ATP-binding protein YxlF [Pleomorphomonas sp. SM30]GLS75871.1 ABC transporter ATP-binding protein [Oharaeibacter diazotrophicus]